MNAVTIIQAEDVGVPALTLPADLTYERWLWQGRTLATQKRQIDWLIGDWLVFGREHFPDHRDQIELALADVVDDDRHIKRIEKTVKAFPPHLRHGNLSFEHHVAVASLPVQEALPLLKSAAESKDLREIHSFTKMVRDYKEDHGHILPREEDIEDDQYMRIVWAWNGACKAVRQQFRESQEGIGLGMIDV